ncbi:hypothetical protein ACFYU5_18835 [Nocardia aobensis]|uniref:Uncharacterized protein n=1 Tax=Nocardia aobensis TaxID=257277 RepID=A0ABW6P5P3_9NOCA
MIVYLVFLCAFAAIGVYATGEIVAKNVHVSVHKVFPWSKKFGHWRTRTDGHEFRITVWRWSVDLLTRGKSYAELVGFPYRISDWIIDEFDSSFNKLAIASLRYHLNHSVAYNEQHREAWEALIERLSERRPEVADTDEKKAVLRADDRHPFEPVYGADGKISHYTMRESTPEERAIMDDYDVRERAYHERIQQARKDFIDVLPYLWS